MTKKENASFKKILTETIARKPFLSNYRTGQDVIAISVKVYTINGRVDLATTELHITRTRGKVTDIKTITSLDGNVSRLIYYLNYAKIGIDNNFIAISDTAAQDIEDEIRKTAMELIIKNLVS